MTEYLCTLGCCLMISWIRGRCLQLLALAVPEVLPYRDQYQWPILLMSPNKAIFISESYYVLITTIMREVSCGPPNANN